MSSPKTFTIKESESEIKKLIKSSSPMIGKRLQALLVFKRHEKTGVSKREVAESIGVNHNSVQSWRTDYVEGGIKALMAHSNIGYKPSLISKPEEDALAKKLNDPSNGMVGFSELLGWFEKNFNKGIKYKTFHGFVVRKFNAKIKVARKYHVKKDPAAIEAFRKTSVRNAKRSSLKTKRASKA